MCQSLTRLSLGFTSISSSLVLRRTFTYASRHRAFPTTLYLPQLQLQRKSKLYDLALRQTEWAYSDGVEISADGLVHPNINHHRIVHTLILIVPVSNGVGLMPNTHLMHEITDNSITYYVDCLSSGQAPAAEPHFLCIPKGTVIPECLTLFHEKMWRFSLQPTHPMSLEDLNKALAQFYYRFGRIYPLKVEPGKWMTMSPWGLAIWDATCDDEDEEKWMKQ
ncbi:uncharacterized protein N7479_010775 [Penicillium vulpinum]|uniref:uncharacterized protein n=1 Tax=Penicillium vulpinum TaxID=29845 RepID=UPI002548C4AC|nr:uncharacterized protein N7479_010775 [Penicillium vulpinum]KAJ5952362.1 hypothetical protein N7479_010775 [Penicillium vulpinum]